MCPYLTTQVQHLVKQTEPEILRCCSHKSGTRQSQQTLSQGYLLINISYCCKLYYTFFCSTGGFSIITQHLKWWLPLPSIPSIIVHFRQQEANILL